MVDTSRQRDPKLQGQLRMMASAIPHPATQELAHDPKLLEWAADMVRAATEFVSKLPHGERTAVFGSVANLLGAYGSGSADQEEDRRGRSGSMSVKEQALRTVGVVGGQVGSTISLVELPATVAALAGKMNPTAVAVSVVLLTFGDKTLMAAGLATDSDKAKCVHALAQVAVNAGFLAINIASGGSILAAIGLGAAITAAAYSARQHWMRHGGER